MKVMKKILSSLLCVVILFGVLPISAFADETVNSSTSDYTKQSEDLIPTDTIEFNGHYYAYFSSGMIWNDAKEYCESLGGYLVCITSQEENDFVMSIVESDIIIGLSDAENEGVWKWVSGEDVHYKNFRSGEPNNEFNEDYACLAKSNGSWNDGHCERELWSFVCEWDSELSIQIPDDATIYNGHAYKIFDNSISWSEAKAFCESIGGYLACINSQEEQNFLVELSNGSTKKNLWIGAKADDNGVYSWVNGDVFQYTNWASGEPNNVFDSQYTAMMYTHNASYDAGLWNDENENGRSWTGYYLSDFGFVCEWDAEPSIQIPNDATLYNGHSYKVYTDSNIGWHDAKVFCENLGGHLATITSADEDAFIYSLVQNINNSYWLGATDEEIEGEWQWVTGEAWDYSNASFDNRSGLQHYLTINYHNGQVWDDQSEKSTSQNGFLCNTDGFICEWDDSYDTTDNYEIKAYTTYPNSQIGTGQFFKIILEFYANGNRCDTEGYDVDIQNSDLVKLDSLERIDNFYSFQFEALNSGTSTLTFIEKASNTTIMIPIAVEKQNEYYRCSVFPSVAHSGSIYITDFECKENDDGTHSISFTAYNRSSAYAVVEVKEKTGISATPIDPHSLGSGTELILNGFIYSFADIFDKNTPYYKDKEQFSETKIKLDNVSEDAEITIYSNSMDSDYISLYTGVDIFTKIVLKTATLDINVEAQKITTKALLDAILKQVPQSSLTQVSQQLTSTMAKGATVETASAIYEIIFNMLENTCLDFGSIIIGTLKGMGYDVADSIVTTLIPQLEVVFLITDVVSIVESLFYSDFYNGKTEIHITKHGLQNYLCNEFITVTQQNNFDNDTVLDAYVVVDESEMPNIENIALSNCSVYNITLRKNGEEVQPSEELEIRVPIPSGANKEKCVIYRIESNGDKTLLSSKIEGDYLVFKTSHLSYYIIGEHTHMWNDCEITKQSTHMEYGEKTYTCRDCGATKTERIEKTTVHTYGDWVKIDDTIHKHTCECGEYETENHVFGDWVITKEASESETGAKEKSCVCGHAVTEEIPKKVVETDPSNSSTDSNDPNESEPSDSLGENNDASIFDMLESIPKKTIIIFGASIAGVILLVVICVIVKKKRF